MFTPFGIGAFFFPNHIETNEKPNENKHYYKCVYCSSHIDIVHVRVCVCVFGARIRIGVELLIIQCEIFLLENHFEMNALRITDDK